MAHERLLSSIEPNDARLGFWEKKKKDCSEQLN